MKRKSILSILVALGLALAGGGYYFLTLKPQPVSKKAEGFGSITVAWPRWNTQASTLVFFDTDANSASALAQRLAENGIASALINTDDFLQAYRGLNRPCLGPERLAGQLEQLSQDISFAKDKPLFIAGIEQGALIPYIHAQQESNPNISNISSGFSVKLPAGLRLCEPMAALIKESVQILVSAPELKSRWRSVWADKPANETAIFIKEKAKNADTYIAEYNTPLDTLLANELYTRIGKGGESSPMPVIEMPAENAGRRPVTLFFSGDGGWRDLDRSVAEEMVKLGYPVLGVDVLRYFWERKTPEQVTSDLSATMRYYRKQWQVKSFILAGFSFGADILPALYNRLPKEEKENVDLLAFLALGNYADFEIHIGGWLGQPTRELALGPELEQISSRKMVCVYGKEEKEKTGTACTRLLNSEAKVIELPGGHHFDKDYPKLARLVLEHYPPQGGP